VEIATTQQDFLALAQVSYQRGNFSEATRLLTELLADQPLHAEALRLLAAAFYQLQNYSASIKANTTLLQSPGATVGDYFNLAHLYCVTNAYIEAEQVCQQGLALAPDDNSGLFNLASVYNKQGQHSAAITTLKRLLQNDPKHEAANLLLAQLENDHAKLVKIYQKKIAEQPLNWGIYLELAKTHIAQGELKKAERILINAQIITSVSWECHYLLGWLAYVQNNWQQAEAAFKIALPQAPDNPDIHLALARVYLKQGSLAQAWPFLQWHTKAKTLPIVQQLENIIPQWRGEPLKNKHLLVIAYPEFGNTLLFSRYITAIKGKHIKISLVVPERYKSLMQALKVNHVYTDTEAIPNTFDYYVSLLNIPVIKQLDYAQPWHAAQPPSAPYKRIGICCKSLNTGVNQNKYNINLELFRPLFQHIKAEIYCIQQVPFTPAEQALLNTFNIKAVHETDLTKLNELLKDLDLMITIGNDIAHLAGNLGKPTWVMLHQDADWVYQAGTTIAWYPSIYCIRQMDWDNWETVTDHVFAKLSVDIEGKVPANLPIYRNIMLTQIKQLLEANKLNEAYDIVQQALAKFPNERLFQFYLGNAAMRLEKFDVARAAYLGCYSNDRNNSNVLNNLSTAFYRKHETDTALGYLHSALKLDPNSIDINRNLAVIAFEYGRFDESIKYFEKLATLYSNPDTNFGIGLNYLAKRDFAKGWQYYEARLDLHSHSYQALKLNTPLWKGEDLNGKTVLVVGEQGLGDTLQFIRYIKQLKQRYDISLMYGCSPLLLRLFKQYDNIIDHFICPGEKVPNHDYHIPLLSIPHYLQLDTEAKLASPPYIVSHPVLANYWKKYFSTSNKLKVGICWSGNSAYANNTRRNCKLEDFVDLTQNAAVHFISLQKDITPAEEELLRDAGIENLGVDFTDLADTAAVINALDLVISIDTSVMHLAGAMGKLTWLLLPYQTEWRHPRDRNESPWYAQVKFIRQPSSGDWRSVFHSVQKQLAELTNTPLPATLKGE
jgi:tetratricopeptide (TPR) repeat protein